MHVRRRYRAFLCAMCGCISLCTEIVCGRTVRNYFSSHGYLFWVGVYERIITQIIQEVNYAFPSRFILIQMLCLAGFTQELRLTTAL